MHAELWECLIRIGWWWVRGFRRHVQAQTTAIARAQRRRIWRSCSGSDQLTTVEDGAAAIELLVHATRARAELSRCADGKS